MKSTKARLVVSGVVVLLAAGAYGCSGAGDEGSTSSHPSAPGGSYALPETPVIKPGSLMAFDVNPDGSFQQVSASELEAKNWDWGDQAAHYPSGSGTTVELEKLLNPGKVLMGFGARVSEGAVTRMRVRSIGILEDWTWDAVGAQWTDIVRCCGDDGQPGMELEIEVNRPFVVTGIGAGITNQNMQWIAVQKREYSPNSRKLVGPKYVDQRGCCWPGERYWETSYVTQTIAQEEKMVVVGLGLREHNDNIGTLRVYAAYLD
jgi:hypothetical protein